jgi:peptide/nickel transport system permease protein
MTVVLTYLIAIPLGVTAGRHQDEWQDHGVQIFNYITYAVPPFVFYILGILAIRIYFRLVPNLRFR